MALANSRRILCAGLAHSHTMSCFLAVRHSIIPFVFLLNQPCSRTAPAFLTGSCFSAVAGGEGAGNNHLAAVLQNFICGFANRLKGIWVFARMCPLRAETLCASGRVRDDFPGRVIGICSRSGGYCLCFAGFQRSVANFSGNHAAQIFI